MCIHTQTFFLNRSFTKASSSDEVFCITLGCSTAYWVNWNIHQVHSHRDGVNWDKGPACRWVNTLLRVLMLLLATKTSLEIIHSAASTPRIKFVRIILHDSWRQDLGVLLRYLSESNT